MDSLWAPTHVTITVNKAENLFIKNEHGTINCYATIALGKKICKTSVKNKSTGNVEWYEECILPIPKRGNTAQIEIKVYSENKILDKSLGRVIIPLKDIHNFEQPKGNWYPLRGKIDTGDENRGMLQVKTTFTRKEFLLDKNAYTRGKGSLKNIKSMLSITKKDEIKLHGEYSVSVNGLDSRKKEYIVRSIEKDTGDSAQEKRESYNERKDMNQSNLHSMNAFKSDMTHGKAEIEINESSPLDKCTADAQEIFPQDFDCSESIPQSKCELLRNDCKQRQVREDSWSKNMFHKQIIIRKSIKRNNWQAAKSISLEDLRWKNLDYSLYNTSCSNINAPPKTTFDTYLEYVSIPKRVLEQYESKSREELIVIIYELQKDRELQDNNSKELQIDLEKTKAYMCSLILKAIEFAPSILEK